MKDESKTNKQQIQELADLRQRIAELEAAEVERIQAEKALRQSEVRYRAVVEQSPDGIFLDDVETRCILEANEAFEKLLGYSAEEIRELTIYDIIAADRGDIDQRFEKILGTEGPFTHERQYRRKDGSLVDVWVSAKVISYGGRRATCVLVRDLTERKRAEEVLRESEERYRAVMEQSADGIFLIDTDSRSLIETNTAFQRMFGYSAEELRGMPLYDFIAADRADIDRRFQEILGLQTGETFTHERKYRRKDGSLVEVWVSGTPIVFGGKRVVSALIRDLTERKQAEERVLRQSAQLDGINKVLQEALRYQTDEEVAKVCLDVAQELTGSKLGFIGEVNRAGRFDTIALSDPGGEACRMPKSDAAVMIKNMEIRGLWGKVLKEGQSLIANDPSSHPDRVGIPPGHSPLISFLGVPLKHAGRTIGMITLANKESGYGLGDQQEIETLSVAFVEALMRKRAEEELRESEERFRAVVEQSVDVIFIVDAEIKCVLEANPAFQNLLGYPPEEIMGLSIYDFIEADRADIDRTFEGILRGQGPVFYERRYRRKDGSFVDIGGSSSPISFGGKKAICVIVRDLTERKRAEEALRESEERYRTVMEQSADGIYLLDGDTKCIIEANRAYAQMLGYTLEEMPGLSMYDFNAADREDMDRRFQSLLTGEAPSHIERPFRRKDGSLLPVWLSANLIHYGGKKVVSTLVRDLTAHKQAEEEREKLIRELQEALNNIRTLRGLVPICANCKKIRDDQGYWQQVEIYVRDHSEAEFTHGLCPECTKLLFPDYKKKEV